MQLDEWIALSPERREERRAKWTYGRTDGGKQDPAEIEWRELAREAAERFSVRYGDIPGVLYVASTYQFDENIPPGVNVRTRLDQGRTLPDLPAEYAGFPVRQEPLGEEIQAFKDTWSAVLRRLFGWEPEAVGDFIASRGFVWESVYFLHDPPAYLLPLSELAGALLGNAHEYDEQQLRRIGNELLLAIGDDFYHKHYYIHDQPDYDWEEARRRIEDVVKKYGTGNPDSGQGQ